MAGPDARTLGLLQLVALGLNGVIGVGIFFVPASVARQVPGSTGAWVYAATAIACLPVALAFARLGRRFEEDGGPYVFARHAFGPGVAFVVGWLAYASALFSCSAVIRGLAESLPWIKQGPSWSVNLAASLIVLGLAALVAAGLKVSAWAWTGITIAKLLPLLLLAGVALWMIPDAPPAVPSSSPVAASNLLRGSLIVLFALQGFEIVAVPAGHVRRPSSVAIATLVALVGAAVLYVGLHAACVRALPSLASSPAPLSEAAAAYGGPSLGKLIGVGTNVSALGIALGMVAMTPRYLSALGRPDGLGVWFGAGDARGVPRRALGITAVAVLVLVQNGSLDELFAMSSISVLAQYGSTAASLIALGWRRDRGLGRGDLAIGLAAAITAVVVASGAKWQEVARAGGVVAVGVVARVLLGLKTRRG
ncbi:MAG TPA: APC family permease [Polyangiaceae bacterium]|nr:APC family permease [Polyangiaceae bacterium]